MKKVFLGLAILATSAFGMMAQNSSDNTSSTPKCQTVCPGSKVCNDACTCDCANTQNCTCPQECRQICDNKQLCDKKGKCPFEKEFAGLNLNDEQKAKIQKLFADRKAERAKAFAERKAEGKNKKEMKIEGRKENRHNLDDQKRKEMRANLKAQRLEDQKKFLGEIKSILTPEQYTQFLENNFYAKADGGKGKPGFRKGGCKGPKGDFKGHKGNRKGNKGHKANKGLVKGQSV